MSLHASRNTTRIGKLFPKLCADMTFSESSAAGARCRLGCRAVDRQAIRYFFNGLTKQRSENIRNHLVACVRCRRKLEAFAKIWFLNGRRNART